MGVTRREIHVFFVELGKIVHWRPVGLTKAPVGSGLQITNIKKDHIYFSCQQIKRLSDGKLDWQSGPGNYGAVVSYANQNFTDAVDRSENLNALPNYFWPFDGQGTGAYAKPFLLMKVDMSGVSAEQKKNGIQFVCNAYADNIMSTVWDDTSKAFVWPQGHRSQNPGHMFFTVQTEN